MEFSLIARIECASAEQRDDLLSALRDGAPCPGGDVPRWSSALEQVDSPQEAWACGETSLAAEWTVADDDDLVRCATALAEAEVRDVHAAFLSDEGWTEIWVVRDGRLRRHQSWAGQPSAELIEAAGDDLIDLLEQLRLGPHQ